MCHAVLVHTVFTHSWSLLCRRSTHCVNLLQQNLQKNQYSNRLSLPDTGSSSPYWNAEIALPCRNCPSWEPQMKFSRRSVVVGRELLLMTVLVCDRYISLNVCCGCNHDIMSARCPSVCVCVRVTVCMLRIFALSSESLWTTSISYCRWNSCVLVSVQSKRFWQNVAACRQ